MTPTSLDADPPTTDPGASDDLAAFIATMSRCARARDVEGLMALYDPGATSFEQGAPGLIDVTGIRANCERGYVALSGEGDAAELDYALTPLRVVRGDDHATLCGVERIAGTSAGGPFALTVRATYCLARVGGQWRIVHQHLSSDG